jgi:hypothetical protein
MAAFPLAWTSAGISRRPARLAPSTARPRGFEPLTFGSVDRSGVSLELGVAERFALGSGPSSLKRRVPSLAEALRCSHSVLASWRALELGPAGGGYRRGVLLGHAVGLGRRWPELTGARRSVRSRGGSRGRCSLPQGQENTAPHTTDLPAAARSIHVGAKRASGLVDHKAEKHHRRGTESPHRPLLRP